MRSNRTAHTDPGHAAATRKVGAFALLALILVVCVQACGRLGYEDVVLRPAVDAANDLLSSSDGGTDVVQQGLDAAMNAGLDGSRDGDVGASVGVTFDHASTGTTVGSGNSELSWNHASTAKQPSYVVVACGINANAIDVMDVQYAGVAAAPLVLPLREGDTTLFTYAIVNPPAGPSTIRVRLNASTRVSCGAISFIGVNAETSTSAIASHKGKTTQQPQGVNFTAMSRKAGLALSIMATSTGESATMLGAGLTERFRANGGPNTSILGVTAPGDDAVEIGYLLNQGRAYCHLAIPLLP